MRRASTCLALLGCLAVLGLPAAASADEPIATIKSFKATAVPIPKPGGGTYPHTGNILPSKGGLGAAVEAEFVFEGSGYGTSPLNPKGQIPPISGVNVYLPGGAKLHPQGFGTCTAAALQNAGANGCKGTSVASPVGEALGEVTIGNEPVPEHTTLQAFFGPGGGLLFYTKGSTPISLEIVSTGHYITAKAPYGPELITQVPPVPTLPGAPLASVKTIKVKAGAAIKKGKKLLSYGTMPTKCPKGGFPVKTEVTFGGPEFGFPAKMVEATYKARCPK
jgi:hypothetical protein